MKFYCLEVTAEDVTKCVLSAGRDVADVITAAISGPVYLSLSAGAFSGRVAISTY